MVWSTLGSRKAKEQNRKKTEQNRYEMSTVVRNRGGKTENAKWLTKIGLSKVA